MKKSIVLPMVVVVSVAYGGVLSRGRSPGTTSDSALVLPALHGQVEYDAIVVGQNHPAVDVPAVQAAVDGGGKVLLRGTFNFGEANESPYDLVPTTERETRTGPTHVPANGTLAESRNPAFWVNPPKTVFVTRDVEIHGDSTTEIVGGYRTFTLGYRPLPGKQLVYDMNTDDGHLDASRETVGDYPISPVKVTIANIHFRRSLNASIWLAATKDETRIADNTFSEGEPLVERYWFGVLRDRAIYTVGGVGSLNYFAYLDTTLSDMQTVLPRSNGIDSRTGTPVQGDLIIENNVETSPGGGLLYVLYVGGDISIIGNRSIGEDVGAGMGVFGYFGRTVISWNYVEGRMALQLAEDGYGRHHPFTRPAGRSWSEGDWERATTVISENVFAIHGGDAALLVLFTKDALISDNTLANHGGEQALSIRASTDMVTRNNIIAAHSDSCKAP